VKIIDKTPFRTETGEISLVDRVQGSIKYGFNWYPRLQAQDKVIPVLERILPQNFILLRNITLGGTDIEMAALVLIGSPGVFLINVLHERGIYRAREGEWGTISSGKFVRERTNQLTRTQRMGKALQVFLEHAGLQGMVSTEAILVTANPVTHVESVRPIVRIVMSDALERFAASLSQGRSTLSPETIAAVAQVILTGRGIKQAASAAAQPAAESTAQPEFSAASDNTDSLEFDFKDEAEAPLEEAPSLPASTAPAVSPQGNNGLSTAQWALLIGFGLAEFCLVAGVITFIIFYTR